MEAINQILRDSTVWFINQDPTTISVMRSQRVKTDAGAFVVQPAAPVGEHVVKLIGTGGSGIVSGEGGSDQQWEYVIVFQWGVDVKKGDSFTLGETQWSIYDVLPDNGYETKVSARQYGAVGTDG